MLREELETALREKQAEAIRLHAEPAGQRGGVVADAEPRLVPCRQSDADDAALTPCDLTFMVQLVEEANSSFAGASTAVALVLGWLYGEAALSMRRRFLGATSFSKAFEVIGMLNDDAVRKSNAACDGPWGDCDDGANKGRTTPVLAYSREGDGGKPETADWADGRAGLALGPTDAQQHLDRRARHDARLASETAPWSASSQTAPSTPCRRAWGFARTW